MKGEVASDCYDHNFGTSPPLSLGVEEELLLIDEQQRLVAESELVLERVSGPAAERVSTEIFAEQIELKTGICHSADDVLAELREMRRTVADAGFRLLGAGLHPASSGEPTLVAKPRYEVVRKDFGSLLSTPPCGLHVHVGIPDPDTAVRLANAFRLYLPVLQALSANSPFRGGADSGHASARTSVVRSYPRFQLPRQFRDYEDFCRVADELIAAAGVDDYTYIWWDVRPHPTPWHGRGPSRGRADRRSRIERARGAGPGDRREGARPADPHATSRARRSRSPTSRRRATASTRRSCSTRPCPNRPG